MDAKSVFVASDSEVTEYQAVVGVFGPVGDPVGGRRLNENKRKTKKLKAVKTR